MATTMTKEDPIALAERLRKFQIEHLARKDALTAERTKLHAEIDALYSAPLCPDDVLQTWCAYIDRMAGEHAQANNQTNEFFNRCSHVYNPTCSKPWKPLTLRNADAIATSGASLTDTHGIDGWDFVGHAGHSARASCYWFGDIIKKKLTEQFTVLFPGYEPYEANEAKQKGTVAERRKRIAALQSEVERVNRELAQANTLIQQIAV